MAKVNKDMAKEIEEEIYVYEDVHRKKEEVELSVSFTFKHGTKPVEAIAEILNLQTFAKQNNIGKKIKNIEFDMFTKQEEE
tara:strand:+ start:217 stop:459 length:243 start_codon:yes stop_codon:yes gene_type:complete